MENPDTGHLEGRQPGCIRRSKFIPSVLYEDSQGDIWIGTSHNGLLRYTSQNHKLSPISGIGCTEICSIEEDIQGNLWISTLYGLSKYERRTNQISNYYASDGIGGINSTTVHPADFQTEP